MVTLRDIQRSISHAIRTATAESDGQATLDEIDEYLVQQSDNSNPGTSASTTATAETAAIDRLSNELVQTCQSQILSHKLVNVVSAKPEAQRVHNQHYLILRFVRQLLPVLQPRRVCNDWWKPILMPILQTTSYIDKVKNEAKSIVTESMVLDSSDEFVRMIVNEYLAWSENHHKREVDLLEQSYEQDETTQLRQQHQALLDLEQDEWSKNLVSVLLSYGASETKRLFMMLNDYFLSSKHRLQIVYLLSEFLLRKRTHLHEILETELFTSMLKSLMYDNSTTLIAISVTNLIMLLPRMCTSLPPYLPQLFYIFARALCWDQLRDLRQKQGITKEEEPKSSSTSATRKAADGWDCADYTFSKLSAPPSNPQTGPFFTSLYGLYPCNFLKFLHKPYAYFEENKFDIPEEFDEETFRTRTIAQVSRHMLHPSLVTMDTESELTDRSRWMKMEPPDVIAQIMSLDLTNAASRVAFSTGKDQKREQQEDLLDESVWAHTENVSEDDQQYTQQPPPPHDEEDKPSHDEPPTATVQVDLGNDSLMARDRRSNKAIKNILDMHQALRSGTEVLIGDDVWDAGLESFASPSPSTSTSPVIADPITLTVSAATADELRANHGNTSETSLASSNISPETRLLIAALKREVLLLRNELNFELFVKQQHLQHMGRLHREHMVDSSVEAERQRTYNATRMLRAQLKQATAALNKLKTESARTKQKHVNWENEQSEKLRGYREARKKWQADMEEARQKLQEYEKAAEARSAELLEAQKRVFELESELKTHEPLLEKAEENEHRVMQLTKQMLLWQEDTTHLEEQKEYIKGLLSQWRSMEELVESLQAENQKLSARQSELEAEQDRLKAKMAEQQTTSPNNALEEDEKVQNHCKKQVQEQQQMISKLKERIETLEMERLELLAKEERDIKDE